MFLDTPFEVAARRCEQGKSQVPPNVGPEARIVLLLLRDALVEIGVEVLTIDGSLPVSEIKIEIASDLSATNRRDGET